MSHDDMGDSVLPGTRSTGGSRRRRSRLGCILGLVVVLVVVAGAYFALTSGARALNDRFFADPEDYPGPGTGSLAVEINQGDSLSAMGDTLAEADVVASAEAFRDAAAANPDSTAIQPGVYELRSQMTAAAAVAVLADPANIVQTSVTVPEGLRVVDVVKLLARETDIARRDLNRAVSKTGRYDLPAGADGSLEGYLFPATYDVGPNDGAVDVIAAMVERWRQAAAEADLDAAASRLGYTVHELMTVASLVEAESRPQDMAKVARVIYNRLENPDNGVTNGLLQIDATVNYALGRNLGLQISQDDLDVDSPYNTRRFPGLPPGPIEAPGSDAIEAAANPAQGNWLFYVTVNPATGETRFTDDYNEFLGFADEFRSFCSANPGQC